MKRFKRKWMRILIWTGAVLLVVGIGGAFALNYAVDKVLDSLATEAIEDIVSSMDTSADTSDSSNESSADSGKGQSGDSQAPSSTGDSSGASDAGGSGSGAGASGTESSDHDGTSGSDRSSSQTEPSKDGASSASYDYSAEVSTDRMAAVKDNVKASEKARVLKILLAKLDLSDIQLLQELASGGLSVKEKREARDLLLEKLTPEEYNELIQIAKKYGLSQGKTYEEVKKE